MSTHDQTALDGERLRQLRRERGLSARKLSEHADLCVRQIWRMEAGHRPNVRSITVARIALALACRIFYSVCDTVEIDHRRAHRAGPGYPHGLFDGAHRGTSALAHPPSHLGQVMHR